MINYSSNRSQHLDAVFVFDMLALSEVLIFSIVDLFKLVVVNNYYVLLLKLYCSQ